MCYQTGARCQLRDLGQAVTGEELVQLAKEAGIDYTEAELQTAFKHDWVMRRHAVACRLSEFVEKFISCGWIYTGKKEII